MRPSALLTAAGLAALAACSSSSKPAAVPAKASPSPAPSPTYISAAPALGSCKATDAAALQRLFPHTTWITKATKNSTGGSCVATATDAADQGSIRITYSPTSIAEQKVATFAATPALEGATVLKDLGQGNAGFSLPNGAKVSFVLEGAQPAYLVSLTGTIPTSLLGSTTGEAVAGKLLSYALQQKP